MWSRTLVLSLIGLSLAACAPVGEKAAQKLAKDTSASVDCKSVDSYFFNYINSIAVQGESFPDAEVVEESLRTQLEADFESGRLKTANKERIEDFITEYMKLYKLSSIDVPKKLGLTDSNQVVAALSALELGDRTTDKKKQLQAEWQKIREPLVLAAKSLEGGCEEPPPSEQDDESPAGEQPVTTPLLDYIKGIFPTPVYGAMKTVAVAYQTCGALVLPPMDTNSPSVEGLEIYGRHPNGSGNLRRVASLSDVVRTHYYIRDQYPPQTSCAKLRDEPLIYDYGGKPAASTSMSSRLDLFKNAGTGGSGLGIDCSGYVFTAYATAGLKMRQDQPLKASQVYGISAGMMKEPADNGLTCLSKAYGDLKPGDLIASSGHIVLVDAVASDPFGVAQIDSASECKLSNMSPTRFDFVISQSTSSKGAIGINRMLAADYFSTYAPASMRDGLKAYAVSACLKRFGINQAASTSQASVVRHRGTASCKSEPVELAKQECLASCEVSVTVGPNFF